MCLTKFAIDNDNYNKKTLSQACNNYDKNNNDNIECKNNSNKIGRKVLYGSFSDENFFAFTYALRAFAD